MNFFRKQFLSCAIMAFIVWASTALSVKAQTSPANADHSWTTTSETITSNANPSRTTESHTKSGNRTLDKKIVEVLGLDGKYQPYFDIETETIQDSSTATQSITRTYNPDADGHEQLTQVMEAETQNSAEGSAHTVRTISKADPDGNLNVVEREVTATTKGPESQETQTTIYLPNISGNLAPSMQIHEQQEHGADGEIETKKTTLFPDAKGGWQLYEVREHTIKGDALNRTSEDRTSRRDFEGNVSPVSQAIAKETNVDGQVTTSAEMYSVDVPGRARDEALHPVQQATSVRTAEPGRIITEQQVVQPDPGETDLSTSVKTKDILVVRNSGTEETITVTAQYLDGYPSVVSMETHKSDQVPAIQQ